MTSTEVSEQAPKSESGLWKVEFYEDKNGRSPFEKWFLREDSYVQSVVTSAVQKVLAPLGQDICSSEWGKPLGGGLYEFRIRQTLGAIATWGDVAVEPRSEGEQPVLLRIFLAFHGDKIVLLLGGYNKKKDPSPRRQAAEIKKAKKLLREWRSSQKR